MRLPAMQARHIPSTLHTGGISMHKIPVIFDCDPGLDDAMALMLACASEELDIKAVTTVCGNARLTHTTQNALNILAFLGRPDIPVAAGAAQPILQPLCCAAHVHGETGLGRVQLPTSPQNASELSACQMMAAVVEQSHVPVTLVATGPCTNVAAFLLSYPYLSGKIERISVMGGGFRFGNAGPVAEFNFLCDPEAAQIVLQSGIHVDLYGLDVTHRAMVLREEYELFREAGDEISAFAAEVLNSYDEHYGADGGGRLPGCPLHDACAVAGLLAPRLFEYHACTAQVDLDGHHTRGSASIDLRCEPLRSYPYNAQVAMNVERRPFVRLLLQAAQHLAERKGATA